MKKLVKVIVSKKTVTLPSGVLLTSDGEVYMEFKKPEKPEKKKIKKSTPGAVYLIPCPFM